MHQGDEVCVVGMGYVGLTLAVTLADIGYRVWGYERQPELVAALNSGRSPMFEPGVEDVLRRKVGDGLTVAAEMPQDFEGTVVICVSTPVGADNAPDLTNLVNNSHTDVIYSFGYRPAVDLKEGLGLTWEWYRRSMSVSR